MSINEAMNILGLKKGFSIDELNKSYKSQMMKWHPDICKEEKSEEMTKKINEARDVLKNYYFRKDNNTRQNVQYNYQKSSVDLELKKSKYINNLSYLLDGIDKIIIDEKYSSRLVNLLVNAKDCLSGCMTSEILDKMYLIFKNGMLKIIGTYVLDYCYTNLLDCTYLDSSIFLVDKKHIIDVNDSIGNIYFKLQNISNSKNFLKKKLIKFNKRFL